MFDDPILRRIDTAISKHDLISTGFHIVAGVSGGADSVCLLRALCELRSKYSLTLTAVHVNHMLRGMESDEDEKFTLELCKSLDVPVRVFHADIEKISRASNLSLEDAGRRSRYSFLEQVLRETGADVIAVAHNFEDQAETVMQNILRGCGIEGLAGMDFRNGSIIRPLLGTRRRQILDYLEGIPQGFRTDSSNLSGDYSRNRVRNILFPLMKEQFSIDPSVALNRLCSLARRDDSLIEGISSEAFTRALAGEENDSVGLDASAMVSFHPAVAARVIRMAWEKYTGSRKMLESIHVDNIMELISGNSTGKSITLPGGIIAGMSYGKLIIGARTVRPERYTYPLSIPGSTAVAEAGGVLTARVLNRTEFSDEFKGKSQIRENSNTQIFDYLKFICGINIRNRRDGDRIRPSGSPGGRKLKEFFIDRKVPADKRDFIPLVAKGGNVLWVIGMRTSEDARVDESTETYLVLEWRERGDLRMY